ncbi:MAG: DUF3568 family protein, partial [Planctomycetota bacterium]|nr:DUF3568 family protein [Planctomycetota bacterium]
AMTACESGATKAGTNYEFALGELNATVPHGLDETFEAAKAALEHFELTIESARKDAFEGRVIARGADNSKHVVDLTREGDEITRLEIAVGGAMGDEERSVMILEEIESRLE